MSSPFHNENKLLKKQNIFGHSKFWLTDTRKLWDNVEPNLRSYGDYIVIFWQSVPLFYGQRMATFWGAGGVCKVCLFYIQWAPEYRKQFAKCPTRLEQNFRDWARIWDIFNVTVFELPEKRHECTFKVNLKTSQKLRKPPAKSYLESQV